MKNDCYVKKILKKLEKFGLAPDLHIDQDTFLKAAADLQLWELCCPDIAAAVEVRWVQFWILCVIRVGKVGAHRWSSRGGKEPDEII